MFDKIQINSKLIDRINAVLDKYKCDEYFSYVVDDLVSEEKQEPELVFKDGNISFENAEPKQTKEMIINIDLHDDQLVDTLKKFLNDPELQSSAPCLPIQAVYWAINDLRLNATDENKSEGYDKFLSFTEDVFQDKYSNMDNMIKNNNISFDMLWYYFDKPNKLYKFKHHNEWMCCRYKEFTYFENFKGQYTTFNMTNVIIELSEGKTHESECDFEIKKYKGVKKIDKLPIRLASEQDLKKFAEYGQSVLKYTTGFHHRFLNGDMIIKIKDDDIVQHKSERVMVDVQGSRLHGNMYEVFDLVSELEDEVKETHIVYPFLPIYNLGIDKIWGRAHIKNISSFEYEKDAFDYLVLDDMKKTLIQSLINNRCSEHKDFISDKGNNTIFLLSGQPGVGKSLTAEATAEYLQLPLYRINVGDLGTNSEYMESVLSKIFALTERWNAIILIDEVDIFLEARCDFNIVHNAMVSTFMKILDYNNSIIFLTTNRLSNIDPAVKSRINLLLTYANISENDQSDKRTNIWKGLLKQWNIELEKKTVKQLSKHKLNGREIRNIIKTVLSLAKSSRSEMTDEYVLKTVQDVLDVFHEFDYQKSSLYG